VSRAGPAAGPRSGFPALGPRPGSPAIPQRSYRDCAGEFATGVTVVIAEAAGEPQGMTLNSFASVSLEPLLVMVALGRASRTLSALRVSRRFSISVLGRAQREVAIELATPGAPFPRRYARRTADGFLVIDGAIATHQCVVHALRAAGDHELVLGRVIGISHRGGEPLIFHRGRFGGLEPDAFVPPGHPIALYEGAGW
jgi:3-hydroxy-9,10-secoandrosta-1,3,5(10)-triene-9,17-dione monooxygenase reductase component